MIRITKLIPNPIPIGATVLLSSAEEIFQDDAFNAAQAKELRRCRDAGHIRIEHVIREPQPEQQPTELPPPPSLPKIPDSAEEAPLVLTGTASAETGVA